jgi:hypothetical protein
MKARTLYLVALIVALIQQVCATIFEVSIEFGGIQDNGVVFVNSPKTALLQAIPGDTIIIGPSVRLKTHPGHGAIETESSIQCTRYSEDIDEPAFEDWLLEDTIIETNNITITSKCPLSFPVSFGYSASSKTPTKFRTCTIFVINASDVVFRDVRFSSLKCDDTIDNDLLFDSGSAAIQFIRAPGFHLDNVIFSNVSMMISAQAECIVDVTGASFLNVKMSRAQRELDNNHPDMLFLNTWGSMSITDSINAPVISIFFSPHKKEFVFTSDINTNAEITRYDTAFLQNDTLCTNELPYAFMSTPNCNPLMVETKGDTHGMIPWYYSIAIGGCLLFFGAIIGSQLKSGSEEEEEEEDDNEDSKKK